MSTATPNYALRPSVEADYDVIAEIWHDGASLPGVGPPVMPTRQDLRSRVDTAFAAGWVVTIAAREHCVLGFVAIKPLIAILAELFVRPDLIGSGIGRALLTHSIVAMPSGFILYTASSNARARRFYEKSGLNFLHHDAHPRTGHPVTYYGWTPR